jgi:hypothetical protein
LTISVARSSIWRRRCTYTPTVPEGNGNVSVADLGLSYAVVTLFVVIVVMERPPLRAAAHDNFEVTHRFCGWAAIVLVWINTGFSSLASAAPGR